MDALGEGERVCVIEVVDPCSHPTPVHTARPYRDDGGTLIVVRKARCPHPEHIFGSRGGRVSPQQIEYTGIVKGGPTTMSALKENGMRRFLCVAWRVGGV